MRLSIVVAWRAPNPHMERVWAYLQRQYARLLPEAEIVVGTDDGVNPFHKTLALNRAMSRISDGAVLLTDADTWIPVEQLRQGVAMLGPDTWVRPWGRKVKLGEADTEELLATPDWDETIPKPWFHARRAEIVTAFPSCPPQLFLREQFDRAGGMDERFRGWGQEDEAFSLAMRVLVGRPKNMLGWAVHLWHPRIGRTGRDLWPGQERDNADLIRDYRTRTLQPAAMETFVHSRGALA